MRSAFAVIALILSSSLVHAAPVTLTVNQAGDVYAGLVALDGADKIAKDGEHEKVVKLPYKLGPIVMMDISKDEAKLKPVVQSFQEVHNKKLSDLTDGSMVVKDKSPEALTLMAFDLTAAAQTQDVDLIHITVDQLNLDVNQIPPSVLSLLSPILDEK